MISTRADRRSLQGLMDFLTLYERGSGQKMNKAKSFFAVSAKCSRVKVRSISSFAGMASKHPPIDYLGYKLVKGRVKSTQFQPLIDKLNKRLARWKGKLLTIGGRMILIKHVLVAIPLHNLLTQEPPKQVLHRLEQLMSRFFWGTIDGDPK